MDSNMNYRHAQVHAAELQRRAELRRMATSAREAKREAKPQRTTRLRVPSLAAGVISLFARRAPRRV